MKWPQYSRFRQLANDYKKNSGESLTVISCKLGINLYTYRNYLYGSKKPGLKTLKSAARLFGCPITEFIDDPGTPLPDIERELWTSVTERDRAYAHDFLRVIQKLSDKEKDACYDMWKQLVKTIITKKKPEKPKSRKVPKNKIVCSY